MALEEVVLRENSGKWGVYDLDIYHSCVFFFSNVAYSCGIYHIGFFEIYLH